MRHIYLYGTIHISIDNYDIKDRCSELADHFIDQVEVVYTEIKRNFVYDLEMTIDDFIALKTYQAGKELRPLENERVFSNSVSDFDSFASNFISTQNLTDQESQDRIRAYLTSTPIHAMAESDTNSELTRSGIKRNFFWMHEILHQSQVMKKSSLVVNGSGHNSGQYGLPNLLAYEGYTLTPLMQCAPETKKSIARKLVFGNQDSFFQRLVSKEAAAEAERNREQQMQIVPYRRM